MNLPRRSRTVLSGFTLVELLVVIAIIAILAAVIAVSAGSAINAAKRSKSSNTAIQIQTAIINYYTEYGVYPLSTAQSGGSDVLMGQNEGTYDSTEYDLTYALCGNINPASPNSSFTAGNVPNTRNIAFLTLKASDVDKNGTVVNPFSSGGTYYYYSIAIDANYDGILQVAGMPDFSNWKVGSTEPTLANGITQGVAVWTSCDPKALGANAAQSTNPNFWTHTY